MVHRADSSAWLSRTSSLSRLLVQVSRAIMLRVFCSSSEHLWLCWQTFRVPFCRTLPTFLTKSSIKCRHFLLLPDNFTKEFGKLFPFGKVRTRNCVSVKQKLSCLFFVVDPVAQRLHNGCTCCTHLSILCHQTRHLSAPALSSELMFNRSCQTDFFGRIFLNKFVRKTCCRTVLVVVLVLSAF